MFRPDPAKSGRSSPLLRPSPRASSGKRGVRVSGKVRPCCAARAVRLPLPSLPRSPPRERPSRRSPRLTNSNSSSTLCRTTRRGQARRAAARADRRKAAPRSGKRRRGRFFGQLSQQVDAFSGEILAGAAMVVDAPRLFGWARAQIIRSPPRASCGAKRHWLSA